MNSAILAIVVVVTIPFLGLTVWALRRSVSRDADWVGQLTEADRSVPRFYSLILNVDLPAPEGHAGMTLACPHCDYELPFDDLSLVGESVACPHCERLFLVLSPDQAMAEDGTQ